MDKQIAILKGIHPGVVLENELKRRKIPKGQFAQSIQEFPQTLGAITKGKRNMNTNLALRIEEALGIEEGFFMILQAYYEIKQEKLKHQVNQKPNLSKIKRILFWDTDFDKIDWINQKVPIIKRVFERGSLEEKKAIMLFYGVETVREVLNRTRLSKH